MEQAWLAGKSLLLSAGLEINTVDLIIGQKNKINPDQELEIITKNKIDITTIKDNNYPKLLKEIYCPPPLLYHYGQINLSQDYTLAVVGSRKYSEYGRQVTFDLIRSLSSAGMVIISGLALGIDTFAHQAAVEQNGKTIAVVGSGLDLIYPSSNRQLAEKIIATGGAIISEFPPGTPPYKSNFPQRNKTISGLSLGTLIIEANIKSGALITAQYALEQNREIFTVPGNIYQATSAGCHKLIKDGAKLVTAPTDILEALNLEKIADYKTSQAILPENETEKIILEIITAEPTHVDKIAQASRLNISVINATLALMEMKGSIKNLGSQKYIKSRWKY